MKYVMVHAGGMADRPRPELGGRTPLQASSTPNLDRLAQIGELGQLLIPMEGVHHGSGLIGAAILGYDPKKFYQGPGPLEAASLGVSVTEHDVVYRCTMVTLGVEGGKGGEIKKLGPHVIMEDATAGLIETEDARELIDAINEQLGSETIQFYPGAGHRHLMVWVNGKPRAVCNDPQKILGQSIADALPTGDGADTLRKLMDAAYLILRDHPVNDDRLAAGKKPANCVWLWGEGRAVMWPSLAEKYDIAGAILATSDVYRGVGMNAGLEAVDPERLVDGDFRTKAAVALEELAKKDFVYVHAELTDEVIHGTDIKAKVHGIEEFDRNLVGPLVDGLGKQGPYRFLIICDHAEDPQSPAFYAFGEGGTTGSQAAGRRFTEADALAMNMPARDATKFVNKFFSKS
ncbi:MAG: 2,3-bisphosphoglycerate-independent phosphoglycerate mutase [Nitrospira sp.]|jgi:2,3-bisphosphoglycerate-independent phosphoglycerate mutase|nr:MAG: 2,3-bisphosphoglycerate-independent phosphoglycerate mutase [Nitrospira sp.]